MVDAWTQTSNRGESVDESTSTQLAAQGGVSVSPTRPKGGRPNEADDTASAAGLVLNLKKVNPADVDCGQSPAKVNCGALDERK